jgi:hypothetical protein
LVTATKNCQKNGQQHSPSQSMKKATLCHKETERWTTPVRRNGEVGFIRAVKPQEDLQKDNDLMAEIPTALVAEIRAKILGVENTCMLDSAFHYFFEH